MLSFNCLMLVKPIRQGLHAIFIYLLQTQHKLIVLKRSQLRNLIQYACGFHFLQTGCCLHTIIWMLQTYVHTHTCGHTHIFWMTIFRYKRPDTGVSLVKLPLKTHNQVLASSISLNNIQITTLINQALATSFWHVPGLLKLVWAKPCI